MHALVILGFGWLGALTSTPVARACDVCAIYTATEMQERRSGIRLGVAEQFSRFTTRIPDASGTPKDEGEYLNGSTTQVLLGWDPRPLFGFQINLPIIGRSYRRIEDGVLVGDRIEDGVLVDGNETGIGDMSLIGILRPWSWTNERSVVRLTLLGGLEFPTGDSSWLQQEEDARANAEAAVDGAVGQSLQAHHIPAGSPSGINGHDLALGSGSWDGVVGGFAYGSFDRMFLTTSAQYAIRSQGSYGYQYGNEVNWFVALGGYLLLRHDSTLALQFVTSGSYQRPDTLDGTSTAAEGEEDAARLWVYVGPGLSFTWGTSITADIAGDLPVKRDDVGLIPQYRIRGGMTYRF